MAISRRFLQPINLLNSASNPSEADQGDFYYNTSSQKIRIYDGENWIDIGPEFFEVGENSPENPQKGQGWFDNVSGDFYIYDGTYWQEVVSTIIVDLEQDTSPTLGGNLDASSFNITNVDNLSFDTTPDNAGGIATLVWDDGEGTLKLGLKGGNVSLQLGQENVALCYNGTGSTISNGSVVYITGAQGQRPSVALADADTEEASSKTFGIVAENIANGAEGFVATFGIVPGLNTSGFTAGQALWLSSTAGQLTNVKPSAPTHAVFIGYCLHVSSSSGRIFVNPQNGYEIEELHNVSISSIADNNILSYDSATSLWKNQALVDAIKEIDGTDSGIDADLLDGQHGSYYLNTSSSSQTKTGNLTISGTATTDVLDLNESQITADLKNIIVTTPFLIDSFVAANYRSAEYILQLSQGTNYSMTKIMLIHNGTDVAISEYGRVEIGNSIPYDFSTTFSLGNLEISLICSTANINPINLKFTRTLFDS